MIEENVYICFGNSIKTLRKKHKFTQTQLAHYLGINQTSLVHYENANRKIPLDIAVKIANFFNVSIDSLLMNCTFNEKHLKNWTDEFNNVVFTKEEITELVNYGKYILFRREGF